MVKLFVNKSAAVISFAVLIIIVGIWSYIDLPRESMPEIKQPMVFVTTVYPGVAAREMESLVTRVIEEEIDGLEGLDKISSQSKQSLSFINVEFTSDITVEQAVRKVRERVDIAKSKLPQDAEDPLVKELSSSDWPIYTVVLSHPDGIAKIDNVADVLEDELARIKGVLDVKIDGRQEKEIQINVNPLKLEKYNFSMGDVVRSIQSENTAIPGGLLKSSLKNYSLAVTGEIKNSEDFANIIVKARGVNVPLHEIATVDFTWKDPETYSRMNGKPCITISITKRAGENIIVIVNSVKKRIKELSSGFPAETKVLESYDESTDIKDMVLDLENNIFSALVLVLVVTIFFIGGVNAVFVSLAIPFSMLISFFVLHLMGITLNMVVLFSLVLALGMLVDNGIVIVENIFRHASLGKTRYEAAVDGASEVAGPIIASTLTTVLAFFPIMFMPGIMGDFLSYLPKTVIIVLSSSLLVALSINPVFCAKFMIISEDNMKKITQGSGSFLKLQNGYARFVSSAINSPIKTLLVTLIIVINGFTVYIKFGKEPVFFPKMDPTASVVNLELPEGTPLDITDNFLKKAEKIVAKSPASMKNYVATTGRAASDSPFGGATNNTYQGNIMINYKPFLDRKIPSSVAIDSLNNRLSGFVGAEISAKEIENGPPTGHAISIRITGNQYEILGALADSVLSILNTYSQLKLVDSDFEDAKPEIAVDIDREKASFYGISTREAASAIRNAINGSIAGKFRLEENEYDINVKYSKSYRSTIADLNSISIINNDDERIPLSSIAKISPKNSIGVIKRTDIQRSVEVWADFYDYITNKTELTTEIMAKIDNIKKPFGYQLGKGEGAQMRDEASAFLLKAFIISIFLIFIVLIAQFNSVSEPFILMVTVLFSFSGIFWGYFLTGMGFVIIMTGIGCIALAGVVVNNGIVLIDYTNILKNSGMEYNKAIIEAGKTRLRPVLLTAITTVLGMIPMAFGISFDIHKLTIQFGSESGQMWVPFAWAMIYGLTFATLLTLILVPTLLSLNYRFLKKVRRITGRE